MVAETEMNENQNLEIQDDDEVNEPPVEKLNFEKLFKMAEDPDMEELLRSPLDQALINLQDGNEVKKLSAIRTFPDILNSSDGEKCLLKMLPAIQNCLKTEKSNLDLHCEAAVVYKSIIQSDVLVKKFSGIIDILLESILQNIQHQKEHQIHEKEKVIIKASGINNHMHHLSAAAWLETIVEVADRLPVCSLKQYIIPVVAQQADPVQRVQRRIIATKIINKLALLMPPNDIRKDVCPIVTILCKDTNSNVRAAIAQRLSIISKSLNNAHDVAAFILPCYTQLLFDEEVNVREAVMNNLTEAFPLFTRDSRKTSIFSNIKKITEESVEKKTDILPVISQNFGKWSWELNEVLDQLDKSWILNTYCKMVQTSEERCENATQRNMRLLLKRTCCFNFPCMLLMFKKHPDRLLPCLELFCTDPDEDVRMSIAASYHEILNIFPNRHDLIQPLIELLHSGSSDVIAKIANNMTKIVPDLYQRVNENPGKITPLQLDRLIIGCNQTLRNASSWRSHESLIRSLRVLPTCVSQETIIESFIPLLKREATNVRAIPCRIAACETLLILMRTITDQETRLEIINFLNNDISKHESCYRRTIFIDAAEIVLTIFSKQFFVAHFLESILRMTSDSVSNIRIRATRLLAKIKSKLRLPEDNDVLLRMEHFVRDVLKSDLNSTTRAIINTAAVELSRIDTCCDSSDELKVKEEDRLWSPKEIVKASKSVRTVKKKKKLEEDQEDQASGLRPPSSSHRATSPWRTERKAIAVVRPQPVLTVRSQSPSPVTCRSASPAPKECAGRPSRLPLSAAAKEREKLRKAATDTPPPPTRSARSSSVVSKQRSDAMSSSTPSIDSMASYGLRRSATSTSAFGGSSFTSSSSYSLMHSRSSSNIRRPGYGLSHVSSSSTFERKPSHVSLRVRRSEVS